jgi:hypothetical protein
LAVGTRVITAEYAPGSGFNASSGTLTGGQVVDKATPTATLAVSNSPQIYNGSPQAATVGISVSSVPGAVANILTGGTATKTAAGTYAVTADFVPTDSANYNTLTGLSAGNFVIDKATPTATLAVSNSPQIYNGSPQAATVGISVSSVPGAVANILTGGTATKTAAGTYAVTADFVPTDSANYNTLTGLSAGNFVIQKAPVTATAGGGSGTYNGLTQSPSACTVMGTYTGSLSCSNNPSLVGPTAATYAIAPVVIGDTTNFEVTLTNGSYTINKASSTAVVTFEAGPYMYRGTPFTATAMVTGVGGLNEAVEVVYTGDCTNVTSANGCMATATFAGDTNHNGSSDTKSITITTGFAFNGFHSPIGGSVENGNGGSYANPLKTFKLGSTIPVKFGATWLNGGAALITGVHMLQAVKYSNATDSDPPIDATPTDAATTGNQFRLTSTDWHFNLSTKGNGFTAGTWLLRATLVDGSQHTVWITIKK